MGLVGVFLTLSGLQWATASERWQVVGVSWAVHGRSIRNCWHKFPLDQALDHTQSVRDTKAKILLTSAHQIFAVKVWSLFLLHSNYVLLSLRISFIFPLIVNRADSDKINITIGADSTVLFSISCSVPESTTVARVEFILNSGLGKSPHWNFLSASESVLKI